MWASFVILVFATVFSATSSTLGTSKRNATQSAPLRRKDILIGTCTPEDFAVGAISCEREFFLAFQLDENTPCRNQYKKLRSCILAEVELCIEGAILGAEKKELLKAFETSLRYSRKHYCGKSSSNKKVTSKKKLSVAPDQCNTGYGEQLSRCEAPFVSLYKRDRGSHELCGEYEKTLSCKDKALHEYCKDEMLDLAWTFETRMNPFCGLEEINKKEGTDMGNGDDDLGVDGDVGVDGDIGVDGDMWVGGGLGAGGDQGSDHDEDHDNGDDEEDDDWGTIWSVFESH